MAGDRRSEERQQAERIYIESGGKIKTAEIALKLELSHSKVRKWKTLDKWDEKLSKEINSVTPKVEQNLLKVEQKQTEVEQINDECTLDQIKELPTIEAPPARKGGGQPGNTNALRHGVYASVRMDVLDDDEVQLIEEMCLRTEEDMLLEQIYLYTVRERRIMKRINEYRNMKEPIVVEGLDRQETKRSFKGKSAEEEAVLEAEYNRRLRQKIDNGERMPGNPYTVVTKSVNKDNYLIRWEQELTAVQNKKNAAITSLAKLRLEKQKLGENEGARDVVKDWIAAVTESEDI